MLFDEIKHSETQKTVLSLIDVESSSIEKTEWYYLLLRYKIGKKRKKNKLKGLKRKKLRD